MTSWNFTADGPIEARLSLAAGSVLVRAAEGDAVTVELEPDTPGNSTAERLIDNAEVSFEGGRLDARVPQKLALRRSSALRMVVTLPERSSVDVHTGSADVRCEGELGWLTGSVASGDLRAERVGGNASCHAASGDIDLGQVAGEAQLETASGNMAIKRAGGDVTAKSASGDVSIEAALASVRAKTASGNVRIGEIADGRADVSTVSGDIDAAVPPGIGVFLDLSSLSGRLRTDLGSAEGGEDDAQLTLSCTSVSGNITIVRATVSV